MGINTILNIVKVVGLVGTIGGGIATGWVNNKNAEMQIEKIVDAKLAEKLAELKLKG